MNDKAVDLMQYNVGMDVLLLRKFTQSHMIGRGVWDNCSPEQRKRFIEQGYVKVQENRVMLMMAGLDVMGYKETTA